MSRFTDLFQPKVVSEAPSVVSEPVIVSEPVVHKEEDTKVTSILNRIRKRTSKD